MGFSFQFPGENTVEFKKPFVPQGWYVETCQLRRQKKSFFKSKFPFVFADPPEVSSAQRAVYSGPGDRDVLTCIVKAEPRANVSYNFLPLHTGTDTMKNFRFYNLIEIRFCFDLRPLYEF